MATTIPHTENLTYRFRIYNRFTGLVVASYANEDDAFRAWCESPAGYDCEDAESLAIH